MCYTVCMKKKRVIILAALLLAAAFIFWFFYPLRSYVVMGVYSGRHSRESVMKQQGFSVDIPAGEGWYPFMLMYNADGFASWSGIDADMTILYNFGAFDAGTRTSAIYDPDSDKYCAFYGAYVLRKQGGAFGFSDTGEVDMDAVSLAFEYDYTVLVLEGFGCDAPVFAVDEYTMQDSVDFAGFTGWTHIDAGLTVSGLAHNVKESHTAYLQYGPPTQAADQDFAVTHLAGRMFIRYFEEYGCTVMLYALAPDAATVDACCAEMLADTVISPLQQ
ncbi:MAG: hypothetical protein AAGU77_11915 [Bacillota bacterium]